MDLQWLYKKIYNEFFKKYKFDLFSTSDFSFTTPYYLIQSVNDVKKNSTPKGCVLFLDQEPIYLYNTPWLTKHGKDLLESDTIWEARLPIHWYKQIIFVSEHGSEVDILQNHLRLLNPDGIVVYYFYHALASLDNYRNYWKENIQVPASHDKLFICYQNIVNNHRWHRIQFQLRLKQSGLIDQGLVSYNPRDDIEEVIQLSTQYHNNKNIEAHALKHVDLLLEPSYIDTESPDGAMSTFIDIENCQRAFVHVVSETAFYNGKLHLTEKIFKPIVAKQPFLLLAAQGNLAYLQSYGFKTFSEFWDESYDQIEDNVARVDAVFKILQQLSTLSYNEQCAMRDRMRDILEYNWHHFYHHLKDRVVDELTTNMKHQFQKRASFKRIDTADIDHLNQILKF